MDSERLRAGTIVDVPGVVVGQVQDETALTGCTVIITEGGSVCGVDVRGSSPGTRETDLLAPMGRVEKIHAICLAGGSAFGLDAACGVVDFLEERGIGHRVLSFVVPIVPAAILFDLAIGDPMVRPDRAMGYAAARAAGAATVLEGNAGAGCGATVAKLGGLERAMKGGVGNAARRLPGGAVVGAIVAVNAIGEIRDPRTGEVLAAPRADDGSFLDSVALVADGRADVLFESNTTLGVIATDAALTKAQAAKVAQMAHDGLARTIYPAHMTRDGDVVFALSTGTLAVNVDVVGTLAAEVLAEAIARAIRAARSAGGFPAHSDIRGG